MRTGLSVSVIDPDEDYLGIELRAWNERFAGTTFIFAGFNELGHFAARIAGFPAHVRDERAYEFGSRDSRIAGGYCSLRFRSIDAAGRTVLDIEIEDDPSHSFGTAGTARFRIPVEAAGLDRFVRGLRDVEMKRTGQAVLGAED